MVPPFLLSCLWLLGRWSAIPHRELVPSEGSYMAFMVKIPCDKQWLYSPWASFILLIFSTADLLSVYSSLWKGKICGVEIIVLRTIFGKSGASWLSGLGWFNVVTTRLHDKAPVSNHFGFNLQDGNGVHWIEDITCQQQQDKYQLQNGILPKQKKGFAIIQESRGPLSPNPSPRFSD